MAVKQAGGVSCSDACSRYLKRGLTSPNRV